eukprot:5300967-Pyramimonas_sp.AAC.1
MAPGGFRPWGTPYLRWTALLSMADPRSEFHRLPDPGFLIEGLLIQCPHSSDVMGGGGKGSGVVIGLSDEDPNVEEACRGS